MYSQEVNNEDFLILFYQSRYIIFLFLSTSCSIFPVVTQDTIYAAFQQFIDPIYSYEIEQLKGGLSYNMQYQCSVNGKKYVVRLLNEAYIERKNEILAHVHFADHTIAPHVYYYSDDYSLMIMDFIENNTLSFEDARQEKVLENVAHAIHCIHASTKEHTLRKNIGKKDIRDDIIRCYTITKKNNSSLPKLIDDAFNILDDIYEALEKETLPLVLSHNDLHPRNIFVADENVIFIDWEMVGMNYVFFDVANYSLYACLDEKQDNFLLTHYLKRNPTMQEWDYFKKVKLLALLFNIFGWLAFLGRIPEDISIVKDFRYYAAIFACNTDMSNSHFELTFSLLEKFFQEYESFKI